MEDTERGPGQVLRVLKVIAYPLTWAGYGAIIWLLAGEESHAEAMSFGH